MPRADEVGNSTLGNSLYGYGYTGFSSALDIRAMDDVKWRSCRCNDKTNISQALLAAAMIARDRDLITRHANGSFVAILPDTPPPGARHVGEQIVDALRPSL